MWNFDTIHLEITEKCNASCLQCGRNKNGGEVNQYLDNRELTLKDIQNVLDPERIKKLKKVYMCGNFGDPIAAKDTLKVFEYLRTNNPDMNLSMNTNGSLHNPTWWRKLVHLRVTVRFSIDGLKDTNHIYRQNTDFDKIIENAKAFIQDGGYAIWDYLVFGHNEHQVEEARELSEKLGFKQFVAKKTGRFFSNSKTKGKESHTGLNKKSGEKIKIEKPKNDKYKNKALEKEELLVEQYGSLDNYLEQTDIACKVYEREIYISAEGLVLPCCWLADQLYKWYWPEKHAPIWKLIKDKRDINIKFHNLDEILNGETFNKIQESWHARSFKDGRLKVCALKCGKEFDPYSAQFE